MAMITVRTPQLNDNKPQGGAGQGRVLDNEQAGRIMQLRAQVTGIEDRIAEQDLFRTACARQVEQIQNLINTAQDRNESDQYAAHVGPS